MNIISRYSGSIVWKGIISVVVFQLSIDNEIIMAVHTGRKCLCTVCFDAEAYCHKFEEWTVQLRVTVFSKS